MIEPTAEFNYDLNLYYDFLDLLNSLEKADISDSDFSSQYDELKKLFNQLKNGDVVTAEEITKFDKLTAKAKGGQQQAEAEPQPTVHEDEDDRVETEGEKLARKITGDLNLIEVGARMDLSANPKLKAMLLDQLNDIMLNHKLFPGMENVDSPIPTYKRKELIEKCVRLLELLTDSDEASPDDQDTDPQVLQRYFAEIQEKLSEKENNIPTDPTDLENLKKELEDYLQEIEEMNSNAKIPLVERRAVSNNRTQVINSIQQLLRKIDGEIDVLKKAEDQERERQQKETQENEAKSQRQEVRRQFFENFTEDIKNAYTEAVNPAPGTNPNPTSDQLSQITRALYNNEEFLSKIERMREIIEEEKREGNGNTASRFENNLNAIINHFRYEGLVYPPEVESDQPESSIESTLEIEGYSHVLDMNPRQLINEIVCGSIDPNDRPANRKNAYSERIRQLKAGNKNQRQMASVVEYIWTMYEYGVMIKGDVINIDNISVNWENFSRKLEASKEGLDYYDLLRNSELYLNLIKPLTEALFIEMTDGKSEFAAKKEWNNGRNLISTVHKRLLFGDTAIVKQKYGDNLVDNYRRHFDEAAEIEGFEFSQSEPREAQRNTTSYKGAQVKKGAISQVEELVLEAGIYDASFRSLRSKAAMWFLGPEKSAPKHFLGEPKLPSGLFLQGGYDVKNFDLGPYACLWGLIADPLSDPHRAIATGGWYERNGRRLLPDDFVKAGDKLVVPYKVKIYDEETDKEILVDKKLEYPVILPDDPNFNNKSEKFTKQFMDDTLRVFGKDGAKRTHFIQMTSYYPENIQNYFDYAFGKGNINVFSLRARFNSLFTLPPVDDFCQAPLVLDMDDKSNFTLKRRGSNSMQNYNKSVESLDKVYQMANDAATMDLSNLDHHKKKESRDKFHDLAKDFGTQIAISFSYNWEHRYHYDKPEDYEERIQLCQQAIENARNNNNSPDTQAEIESLEESKRILEVTLKEAEKYRQFIEKRQNDMKLFYKQVITMYVLLLCTRIPWNPYNKFDNLYTRRYNESLHNYYDLLEIMRHQFITYVTKTNTTFEGWGGGFIREVFKELLDEKEPSGLAHHINRQVYKDLEYANMIYHAKEFDLEHQLEHGKKMSLLRKNWSGERDIEIKNRAGIIPEFPFIKPPKKE
jgi:hypothetical protein